MPAGTWNMIIGAVTIIAGASGKFALIGTSSSGALMAIGAAIAGFGVYQFVRARKKP